MHFLAGVWWEHLTTFLVGGAVINWQVPTGNDIFYEEESYLNVLDTLGSGHFPIHLQKNVTLVVLVQNFLLDCISLGLREAFGPYCLWDCIIFSNEIVFSGNLTLYFLLYWKACHITFSKSHNGHCVALTVVMYHIGCTHPKLDHRKVICRDG